MGRVRGGEGAERGRGGKWSGYIQLMGMRKVSISCQGGLVKCTVCILYIKSLVVGCVRLLH